MKMFRFNTSFDGFHIVSDMLTRAISLDRKFIVRFFILVLYRNVFIRDNIITLNYEKIKVHQKIECALVGLLLFLVLTLVLNVRFSFALPVLFIYNYLYFISFVINIVRYNKSKLYNRLVVFEREAHNNSNISSYTKLRRPFNWVKYF